MALVVETVADAGITRLSRWIFNCYVVHDRGDGAVLVVDAGLPGLVDDLRRVLPTLGLSLSSVASVVATHGHSDHVAGVPALVRATGASVVLPAVTGRYVEGTEAPRTPSPAEVARIWPTALDQPFDPKALAGLAGGARVAGYGGGPGGGMRWPAEVAFEVVGDGDPIPGATGWRTLGVPGHTGDSTAFWHEASATLLAGDAVLAVDGRAWVTPEAVDPAARDASGERLRSLPSVRHLFPGHGRSVHGRDVLADALGPDERPPGGPLHRARRWALPGKR